MILKFSGGKTFWWYVSLENQVGQVVYTGFGSRGEFVQWYNKTSSDKDARVTRELFPRIHYQGPSERRCREVTIEAMIPRVMIPELIGTWALAEVDLEAAVERYQQLKENGVIPK